MKKYLLLKLTLLLFVIIFTFSLTSCEFLTIMMEIADADSSTESTDKVTLHFNTLGGTLPSGTKEIQEYARGETIKKPVTPRKQGYAFKGWYTENDKKVTFPLTVKRNITLTARWEEIIDTVAITYKLNGGTLPKGVESVEIYDSGTKLASFPTPTKDNFKFLGWYFGNEPVEFPFIANKSTIVIAKWEQIEPEFGTDTDLETETDTSIDSELETSTDTDLESDTSIETDTDSDEITDTETNTDTSSETDSGDSTETDTETDTETETDTDTETDIPEEEKPTATITFDPLGGALAEGAELTATYPIGKKLYSLPIAEMQDYIFIGWEANSSHVTLPYEITEDTTFTAVWEKAPEKITVFLDANGGTLMSGTDLSFEVVVGSQIGALPVPSLKFYTFNGWFLNGDPESPVDKRTIASDTDMSLVALWQKAGEIITVEFQCDEDVSLNADSSTIEILEGGRISDYASALPVPTRYGYSFLGWYNSDGVRVTLTSRIYESTVLYPDWKKLDLCLDGTENHQFTVWQETSMLTCTTPHQSSRYCTACLLYEYQTYAEPIGHIMGDWKTKSELDSVVRERVCINCTETESEPLSNITTSAFHVPTMDGDYWIDGDSTICLVNGDYTDKNIAGKGTGTLTVVLNAKSPTHVDVFTVTGYGSATYTVTAYLSNGSTMSLGLRSFDKDEKATKAFTIDETVTKIVITMETCSIGSDYWSEISAYIVDKKE